MKHSAWLLLFVFAAGPQYASAQQAGASLNDTQRHGQQLLAQSCGICHLPPERGAKTFGPPLNKLAGALGVPQEELAAELAESQQAREGRVVSAPRETVRFRMRLRRDAAVRRLGRVLLRYQ